MARTRRLNHRRRDPGHARRRAGRWPRWRRFRVLRRRPHVGVDLDHCRDPESGEVDAWALAGFEALPDRPDGIHELWWEFFEPSPAWRQQRRGHEQLGAQPSLDDFELLERARRARNGDRFALFYDVGDLGPWGSLSEADAALAGMLYFWTGPDEGRIARLMWSSALARTKWRRDDYLPRTIGFVVARGSPQKPLRLPAHKLGGHLFCLNPPHQG